MVLCPKAKEPVLDKGDHYVFPGYPHAKCMKHIARANLAAMDYVRVFMGLSPLFQFYSSSRDSYFEARLRFDPVTSEFKFEYEQANPAQSSHPRGHFIDYLKVVYPSWQYTPQKLQLFTLQHVEYMLDAHGKVDPRAVIEYIKLDKEQVSSALKASILERMRKESRTRVGLEIARELGVRYFLIVHTRFLTNFSLFNLSEDTGWHDMDTDGLLVFFQSLQVTK